MGKHRDRDVYEFSLSVKDSVYLRSDGLCEDCRKQPYTEVHHLIPAWYALHHAKVAIEIMTCLENAIGLCNNCHAKADLQQRKDLANIPQLVRNITNSRRIN